MSFADFEAKAEQYKPKAAFLVHIGGHIAFDSEKIAAYCAENDIFLVEDCAHAHGAQWNGRRAGTYGDAGVYSLYATKTVSTGEGGVLVSKRPEILEHARGYRNYGKPSYDVRGLNFRMSEFTAALGLLQIERLPEIVAWKNEIAREYLDPAYPSRLELPDGMTSGFYKYVVFDWLERSTGRVYDEPCHRILGHDVELPNTDWVAQNHSCVPLYYRPRTTENTYESACHRRVRLHRLARRRQAPGARARAGHLRPEALAVARARKVDTVLGSITDREALEHALHSCDAVAHLAAVADVNDVHASPEEAERMNARGTVAVLEACRRAGVQRLVYAARSGSTATASRRQSTRRRCCRRRATSTPRPSSPVSCTARRIRSCTGSSTRSCASGSPTGRAPARRLSSRRSSTKRSRASR